MWVGFKLPCNFEKLHNVEPPLAVLVFGDEGLRPTEPIGQHLLRQPGSLPRCNKLLEKDLILPSVD